MHHQNTSDPRLQLAADAIRAGRTIEAIKHLRDATGMTLREAKDTVEKLMEEQGTPPIAAAGGEPDLLLPLTSALARTNASTSGDRSDAGVARGEDATATHRGNSALFALVVGVVILLVAILIMMMT